MSGFFILVISTYSYSLSNLIFVSIKYISTVQTVELADDIQHRYVPEYHISYCIKTHRSASAELDDLEHVMNLALVRFRICIALLGWFAMKKVPCQNKLDFMLRHRNLALAS